MRLLRVGPVGRERPAVMVPGSDREAYDVSGRVDDFDAAFFGSGGVDRLAAAVEAGRLPRVDIHAGRIGAPIARPHAIYGIGLNYRDHAREVGMDRPPSRSSSPRRRTPWWDRRTTSCCPRAPRRRTGRPSWAW